MIKQIMTSSNESATQLVNEVNMERTCRSIILADCCLTNLFNIQIHIVKLFLSL